MVTYQGKKIHLTKSGQPYIIQSNGMARFIPKSYSQKSHAKRSSRSRSVRQIRKKSSGVKMARRKRRSVRTRVRYVTKRVGSRVRKSSVVSKYGTELGIGLYAIAEGWIDTMMSQFGIPKEIAETIIGWWLMKNKRGVLGGLGKAMFTVNAYQIVRAYFGGGLMAGNTGGGFYPG